MSGRFPGSSSSRKESNGDAPKRDEGQNMEGTVPCGTRGGAEGTPFYDGRGNNVEIEVTHNADHVLCNETSYNQGVASFKAGPHGTSSIGGQISKVTKNYPDEYLIQLKRTFNIVNGIKVVSSLTFITNKRTYGPYSSTSEGAFENIPRQVLGFYRHFESTLYQTGAITTTSFNRPTPVTGDKIPLVEGLLRSQEETTFYDGNHGDIIEIEVAFNKEYILSIQTTYVLNGKTFKQAPHGGLGGDVSKVTFQYPEEHVVQVRGTTREVSSLGAVVTSLTFVTNKRAYGPYGSVIGGTSFETVGRGKVRGFYGRATSCMHSIGVVNAKVEDALDTKAIIVQEAWGGLGGESFYEGGGNVIELLVSYNDSHVVSFQATYKRGGRTFKAEKHGGQNGVGATEKKISLKYPEEYLVQVKGSSHHINGIIIIESLEFITNKQSYGPYGALKPEGQLRSTPKNGKIVGFFGKASHFVDQLGVFISFSPQSKDLLVVQGSWGGPGGKPFNDGRGKIVELLVKYNKKQIISLCVTYEQGKTQCKSQTHGGLDGGETKQISFEAGEYLTQVKGTTGNIVPGGTMVTSLTFITDKKTHGPFGLATGDAFETKAHGKVVGFFGRSKSFLDSIGFITQLHPDKALPEATKLGPWGGKGGHEFYGGQGDIVQIVVYHNQSQINGIQTTYEQGGVIFEPVTYGSTNGNTSKITLDFPNEYLAKVKGTTTKGDFSGSNQVINSLTFITNKHIYGPYGLLSEVEFGDSPSGLVIGFYGREGNGLNQFGVITTIDWETTQIYLLTHDVEATLPEKLPGQLSTVSLDDKIPLVEGPWGSQEETTFYDGNHGDIIEIEVAFGKLREPEVGDEFAGVDFECRERAVNLASTKSNRLELVDNLASAPCDGRTPARRLNGVD